MTVIYTPETLPEEFEYTSPTLPSGVRAIYSVVLGDCQTVNYYDFSNKQSGYHNHQNHQTI
jgi:hypothetical protein